MLIIMRFIEEEDARSTLFTTGRYLYRAWITKLPLFTPDSR